jgi:hypothetical protein
MKKTITAIALAITGAALFTGCVPIHYTRSITVHKDASGNITGTDEYEGFTEAHSEGKKIKEVQVGETPFKYLKP